MGERTRWKMRGLEFMYMDLLCAHRACKKDGALAILFGPAERIPDSEERESNLDAF
jgi:hypothetical protein